MSDFHGGFFIERVDAQVAEPLRAAVLEHLRATGQDPARFSLHFVGREGLPALLLLLGIEELVAGRETEAWVLENIALGSRLARAASARVWAYTYNNQVGLESLASFDAQGAALDELYTPWDECEVRALETLADALGVPYALLEHDLVYGTPAFGTAVGEPTDAEAFGDYLSSLRPVQRPRPEREGFMFYMPDNMADELFDAAASLGTNVDDLFESMWEAVKAEVYASVPAVDEIDGPAGPQQFLDPPPPRAAPVSLPAAREVAELPRSADKVGVRLALSEAAMEEIRALALAGDRSQSFIIQRAYSAARPRLLAALG